LDCFIASGEKPNFGVTKTSIPTHSQLRIYPTKLFPQPCDSKTERHIARPHPISLPPNRSPRNYSPLPNNHRDISCKRDPFSPLPDFHIGKRAASPLGTSAFPLSLCSPVISRTALKHSQKQTLTSQTMRPQDSCFSVGYVISTRLSLPDNPDLSSAPQALKWHRDNVYPP